MTLFLQVQHCFISFTEAIHFRVISVEPLSMRIEVTLRTTSTPKASNNGVANLSSLRVGDIISGNIRRVVAYGLFISIDQTNIVSNNLLIFNSCLTCF